MAAKRKSHPIKLASQEFLYPLHPQLTHPALPYANPAQLVVRPRAEEDCTPADIIYKSEEDRAIVDLKEERLDSLKLVTSLIPDR
jgi:hypothetical protein